MSRITRHFVTVGQRRVHYTRAGDGPAVVMLHESPRSARLMRHAQAIFAAQFTALAFDTPSFGLSDKLPLAQPEIADLADALAETLDALGIAQTAVYGRHTGASIAVEFARRHPARCTMALTGGYPVYTKAQRDSRLSDYLKPNPQSWEGAHLLWLWFRFREQHNFWPWHEQDAAHRSNRDVPDLAFLQQGVMDMLEAGDDYRVVYGAAFRHDALDAAADVQVPVCFATQRKDTLFRTLALLPGGTWTQIMPDDETECAVAERAVLAQHLAAPPLPPVRPVALPGRTLLDYVPCSQGQMLVRSHGDVAREVPVLIVPPMPGSSLACDGLILALGATRAAFAFDLPGMGEADAAPGFVPDIASWAGHILAGLDALGVARVHLVGMQGGCAVAADLALRAPDRVVSVLMDAPPALTQTERQGLAESYAPDLTPVWDGSHLLRCFHHLRDQELWWPWSDRSKAATRASEPRIDAATLTRRAREMLKHPSSYRAIWAAVLGYDLRTALSHLRQPVTVIAAEADVFARFATGAAACCGTEAITVDDTDAARAAAALTAFGKANAHGL